jgi:hypothetical protein
MKTPNTVRLRKDRSNRGSRMPGASAKEAGALLSICAPRPHGEKSYRILGCLLSPSAETLLTSGLFAGLEITPKGLGHIGILGLFDEGGIVDPLVVEFNILLRFGRIA